MARARRSMHGTYPTTRLSPRKLFHELQMERVGKILAKKRLLISKSWAHFHQVEEQAFLKRSPLCCNVGVACSLGPSWKTCRGIPARATSLGKGSAAIESIGCLSRFDEDSGEVKICFASWLSYLSCPSCPSWGAHKPGQMAQALKQIFPPVSRIASRQVSANC